MEQQKLTEIMPVRISPRLKARFYRAADRVGLTPAGAARLALLEFVRQHTISDQVGNDEVATNE